MSWTGTSVSPWPLSEIQCVNLQIEGARLNSLRSASSLEILSSGTEGGGRRRAGAGALDTHQD